MAPGGRGDHPVFPIRSCSGTPSSGPPKRRVSRRRSRRNERWVASRASRSQGVRCSRWPRAAEMLGRRRSRPHRRRPLRRSSTTVVTSTTVRADHHAQSRATRRRRHPRPPRPLLPDDRAHGRTHPTPTTPRSPRPRPASSASGGRSSLQTMHDWASTRRVSSTARSFDIRLIDADHAASRTAPLRAVHADVVEPTAPSSRAIDGEPSVTEVRVVRTRTVGGSRTGSPGAGRVRRLSRRQRIALALWLSPLARLLGERRASGCYWTVTAAMHPRGRVGCGWTRGRMRGRVEVGRARRSSEGRTTTRAPTARCPRTTCWPGTSRTRTRATTTRPCLRPTPTTAAIRPSAGRSPTARPTSAVTCSSGGPSAGGRRRR